MVKGPGKFAIDQDIGKTPVTETTREALIALSIDSNIRESREADEELLEETKLIHKTNELQLGEEVEEHE